jgi:hypothetical protein
MCANSRGEETPLLALPRTATAGSRIGMRIIQHHVETAEAGSLGDRRYDDAAREACRVLWRSEGYNAYPYPYPHPHPHPHGGSRAGHGDASARTLLSRRLWMRPMAIYISIKIAVEINCGAARIMGGSHSAMQSGCPYFEAAPFVYCTLWTS